jgi:uncharacterized protein YndB with AHSA1/START domain
VHEQPAGVDVSLDRDSVRASGVVPAPPTVVFDFLRRPANHGLISGDGSVRAPLRGPELLGPGDRFGMAMRILVPYRVTSRVTEFEPNRRIAWCHFGGHTWRWELQDNGDGTTTVTETFDLSTARLPAALRIAGFPARHRDNVARSVATLAALVTADSGGPAQPDVCDGRDGESEDSDR